MADNLEPEEYPETFHPLVVLMLKRMKSHPEEFGGEGYIPDHDPYPINPYASPNPNRWLHAINIIRESAHEDAVADINVALNTIQLDKAHRWAMDELLNGEERRAKAEAERIANEAMWNQAKLHTYAQQSAANHTTQLGAYAQSLGAYANASATTGMQGTTTTWELCDELETSGGSPTVSSSVVQQIRKKLGL